MQHLTFDEIVRNLLVYLKGQVPSLNSKETRDEILRQVQTISFTLRSTIVQLEGAVSNNSQNSEEFSNLSKELNALKSTNAKLEESLFLEMNKSQEANGKLAAAADLQKISEKQIRQHSELIARLQQELETLSKQKIQHIEVPTIDESVQDDLKKQINSLEQQIAASNAIIADLKAKPTENIDQSVFDELKNHIIELETRLGKEAETGKQLRQALQNKEIELSKSKDALLEIMAVDKTQVSLLKDQLGEFDMAKTENLKLLKKISELERELKILPAYDVYQNNMAATEAKLKFLENSLKDVQTENSKLRQASQSHNLEALKGQKEQLEQRILDLEATLRSVLKSRETSNRNEKFAFTPEDCVFLFETLSTTAQRTMQSPENRDVYTKSLDAIEILEKSNAIQRIPSVGETYDSKIHKVTKAYKNDFLPDSIIIHEETPGFVSGTRLVQKAIVWVGKSAFNCNECNNLCRAHEFFCPKCGLELTAPDGTSKRDIAEHPKTLEMNLKLIDTLLTQGNLKAANSLIELTAIENADSPELKKRKALLLSTEKPI